MLVIAIILTPMLVLYGIVKFFWERFVEPPEPIITRDSSTANECVRIKIEYKNTKLILSSKFSYYQKLSENDKAKFLKRVSKFIINKEFRALRMDLTEEMVVLVSASAIQLTFGLEEYLLDHFSKIFIYPKEFYSRINKNYHKGETNLGGAIVLSWKHFTEGYTDASDNLNLGLHEMAHALRFDKIQNSNYDKFFSLYIDKWQLISKEEFRKIREHRSTALREYGGTNFTEFFSVCVEYFFETPKEFKKTLPEVYKHLCILLNQDPSENTTNYNQSVNLFPDNNFRSETPVLTFKNKKPGIFVQLAGLIPLVIFVCYLAFGEGIKKNFIALYLFLPLLLITSLYRMIQSKKHVHFYSRGLRFESAFSKRFDLAVDYDSIASITIRKHQSKNDDNSIIVHTINNGKIKKKRYVYTFSDEAEIKTIREFLTKKMIPVKTDGYIIETSE